MKIQLLGLLIRSITVAVEGNIGSGKSTVVSACGLLPFVYAEKEPIDEWKNVTYQNQTFNLLKSFYKQQKERFLALQVQIAITFSRVYSRPVEKGMIRLCERQMATSKCFVQAGDYDSEDLAVLNELHQHLQAKGNLIPDVIIYLVTSPGICLKRVQSRSRPEEKDITLEYLQKVHEAHEQWLIEGTPTSKIVVRINANRSAAEVLEDVSTYLRQLHRELGRTAKIMPSQLQRSTAANP